MLVRGMTVFTVRAEDVFIVGLLTRLAVLATWCKKVTKNEINGRMHNKHEMRNRKGGPHSYLITAVCVFVCARVHLLTKGLLGVKIVLIGVLPPPLLPLLGGLILFSFCRRLQNQTRITSFSMLSSSAIIAISSEVGFWFCLKRAKKPEMPCEHCGDFHISAANDSQLHTNIISS